jgi:hypothetical protein
MDGHRFDGLTRALSSGLSRRQTLAVLGAALSGSGLLAALPEEAAALTRKQRRRCKRQGGAVCSAGTKSSQCCSPSGECIHGACACDPFDNTCPQDASEPGFQCGCGAVVGGGAACVDHNDPCILEQPCDSHADCDPGSVCLVGFKDLPDPTGHEGRRCSKPCVPA